MTPVDVFAFVASGLILAIVISMRSDDDTDRKSEWADYVTGLIVLSVAWIASIGLAVLI